MVFQKHKALICVNRQIINISNSDTLIKVMPAFESNQSFFQRILQKLKSRTFRVALLLFRQRKIGTPLSSLGRIYAAFFIAVMFAQITAYFFDHNVSVAFTSQLEFQWQDETFLNAFHNAFDFVRVLPLIEESDHTFFFWLLYGLALSALTLILGLFVYMMCSASNSSAHQWLTKTLETLLLWTYWIFFTPFMEIFFSVFKCKEGKHAIVKTMGCFEGVHIFLVVLSVLFALLLLGVAMLYALLLSEVQATRKDALAKSEDAWDILHCLYRVLLAVFSVFLNAVM